MYTFKVGKSGILFGKYVVRKCVNILQSLTQKSDIREKPMCTLYFNA